MFLPVPDYFTCELFTLLEPQHFPKWRLRDVCHKTGILGVGVLPLDVEYDLDCGVLLRVGRAMM